VFDHLDLGGPMLDARPSLGRNDVADPGGDPGPIRKVSAFEHDPTVGLSRLKSQRDVATVEETDATDFRGPGKGALGTLGNEHSLPCPYPARRLLGML
jgi:hypothetical protein